MFTGCLQSPKNKSAVLESTLNRKNSVENATVSPTPTLIVENSNIYWFSTIKVEGYLTLNRDNQSIIYLKGGALNTYLNRDNNFTNSYCLTLNFTGTTKKQLRIRAIPISYTDFSTQQRERLLKLDLIDSTSNKNMCSGLVDSISEDKDIAFAIDDICPSCTSTFSSLNINLYRVISDKIDQNSLLSNTDFSAEGMGLRVNPSNNTNIFDSSTLC